MLTLNDLSIVRRSARLKNGLRLVVYERPGFPVSIRTLFQSGSRFDPAGKEGLSHLTEHMMTAGTERFPTKDQMAVYVEQYGGQFGAWTNSELMALDVGVGDPDDLHHVTELLGQMLGASRFDAETFGRERGSVLRELGDWQSNPSRYIWEVWRTLAYAGTGMGRLLIGTEETIGNCSIEDAKAFRDKCLTPERAVVVACGGISLEQLVERLEEDVQWNAGPVFNHEAESLKKETRIATKEYQNGGQVQFVYGFSWNQGYSHGRELAALRVARVLLGRGRAARLAKTLRYERGLIYSIHAESEIFSDVRSWYLKSACARDRLPEVIERIESELEDVRRHGVSDDELAFAKARMIKSKRMGLQTVSAVVGFHAQEDLFAKDGESWTLDEYVREVEALTLADVQQAVATYCSLENRCLALCGESIDTTGLLG